MTIDLSVNIAGIKFSNPIILASGPMSSSKAALIKAGFMGVGGVVTKSSTISASPGNPHPHIVMRDGYVINADGIHNQGYQAMANDIYEAKNEGLKIPVIASAAGTSPEEFTLMALEFEKKGASAIELNFVCPNRGALVGGVKEETIGRYWAETPDRTYIAVKAVKNAVKIPVWAKMPFEAVYQDIKVAKKMQEAGADAIAVNTSLPRAMAINLETGKPILGNPRGAGAVGGFIMKPLGVNVVTVLSRAVRIPVIASGGVFSGLDVIEYIMAGARMTGALTAIMQKVEVKTMLTEIENFMNSHGYQNCGDFYGKTHKFLIPA